MRVKGQTYTFDIFTAKHVFLEPRSRTESHWRVAESNRSKSLKIKKHKP